MASTRMTFRLDEALAEQARRLGTNVSTAARDGVAAAVRGALARADGDAYVALPETADDAWTDAEAWAIE